MSMMDTVMWRGEKRYRFQSPPPVVVKEVITVDQALNCESPPPIYPMQMFTEVLDKKAQNNPPCDQKATKLAGLRLLDQDCFTKSSGLYGKDEGCMSDVGEMTYDSDTTSSVPSNTTTPEPELTMSPKLKRTRSDKKLDTRDGTFSYYKKFRRPPTPFLPDTTEASIEKHAFQPYDPLGTHKQKGCPVEMPKIGIQLKESTKDDELRGLCAFFIKKQEG